MDQHLTLNDTVTPSAPSSLLHNIHFLCSEDQLLHITLVINRPMCGSGYVRSDNLACLLTPNSDNGDPLSASVTSHVQEQKRLMSFCITSSPPGPDALACVRVCESVCHICTRMDVCDGVFLLHACVYVCKAVLVLRRCLLFKPIPEG